MPKREDINKVLIIGSGPIIIGQACEFDYSGTQACKALKKLGYEIVLVNSNPATIMTDPEIADVTYIEPLNVSRLEQIIAKERPDALLPNLGGQSGLNLCAELANAGILEKYGQRGVEALVIATPKATGKTAASWSYEIKMDDNGATLCWKNANIVDGVPIAVILQYGHGTRNGGYVQGTDYINPVMKPLFDEIAAELWREVRKA